MVQKHKTLIKHLREIAFIYGVDVSFAKKVHADYSGEYDQEKYKMVVEYNATARDVLSTFFHELGHYVDQQTGKFIKYYKSSTSEKHMRKIALRAEIHADDVGNYLCKKYFGISIKKHYRTIDEQKYLLSEFKPQQAVQARKKKKKKKKKSRG